MPRFASLVSYFGILLERSFVEMVVIGIMVRVIGLYLIMGLVLKSALVPNSATIMVFERLSVN